MSDLSTAISVAYNSTLNSRGYHQDENVDIKSSYMVIPLNKGKFEVPVFAMAAFEDRNLCPMDDVEAIVAKLYNIGIKPSYKSLDAAIRNTLYSGYRSSRLQQLPVIGDNGDMYYSTQGAIFDSDFNPVMLMTWEIEEEIDEQNPSHYSYRFIKPILRVSPEVIIYKGNAMDRYIINKIIPTTLSLYAAYRPIVSSNSHFVQSNESPSRISKVKVVIEKIPFDIKKPDVPSISTTNKDLLRIALDNIEELVL